MRRMYGEGLERDAGGRAMSKREIFTRVRSQVLLVRRLSEQMREMAPDGLRSLWLDGMPRQAGSAVRGLDVQMEKREAMERMLRRESELLRSYEEAARSAMDGLKPEHYAFCAMYYIGAFSMEETAEAIDRSLRQCTRYKREIEMA